MLCLPRKVTLMIDPRHIWNVIYNAQSNRTHPPTSPNTAPATQNDSHEWCPSHMKRHLQWAEQQVSSTNVTKYCACCLPRKMTLMIDVRHIWNVIYNARSNRHHPPTSPNTAPATQNCTPKSIRNICRKQLRRHFQCAADSTMIRPWNCKTEPVRSQSFLFPPRQRILYWKLQHFALRLSTQISPNTAPATKSDTARAPNTAPATKSDSDDWSSSHMKRHLQCAEQQDSSSNVTKYCTCHAKWLSWVMSVTYETSFTMRGATGVIHQRHQVLCLPRKMTLMIDVRHIWNVIYNARSNRHHPPTSPNTAPATQNCTPKSKKNLPKTVEASFPMRGRFDHDPDMIRPWNCKTEPVRSQSLLFPPRQRILYWKLQHFALRLSTDFTEYCTCHEKWHRKITKYCACHEKWLWWLILVTYETSFTMRGATGLPLQRHQALCLPRKMTLMSDVRHILNVIYNARSNRHHPPTSPNAAPAT